MSPNQPRLLRRSRRGERGFTLVETAGLLVVVAILASMMYTGYRHYVIRARAAATVQLLTLIQIAMIRFEADCGGLPRWDGSIGDPGLCYAPADVRDRWGGPYLNSWPQTTPLGGTVVYTGIADSTGESPPQLSVAGLSPQDAEVLSNLARDAFGSHLIPQSGVGGDGRSVTWTMNRQRGGVERPLPPGDGQAASNH